MDQLCSSLSKLGKTNNWVKESDMCTGLHVFYICYIKLATLITSSDHLKLVKWLQVDAGTLIRG